MGLKQVRAASKWQFFTYFLLLILKARNEFLSMKLIEVVVAGMHGAKDRRSKELILNITSIILTRDFMHKSIKNYNSKIIRMSISLNLIY